MKWALAVIAAPLSVAIFSPSVAAQNSEPTVECGAPLGPASLTVREIAGDTIFTYSQNPATVEVAEADITEPAFLDDARTLTFRNLSFDEAVQLIADNPIYYATLTETTVEALEDNGGFAPVRGSLVCAIAATPTPQPTPVTPTPVTPAPVTPPVTPAPVTPTPPAPPVVTSPTLADLPDGNYRMTSAEYPVRVVTDEELLANGGYLFVFRKRGDAVTGIFGHIDGETGACITGTVSGDTITGQAYTNDQPATINGTTYLGPLQVLQLGTPVNNLRYDGSVMNVESLFRINAGTRIPVETCEGQFS